MAQSKPLQHISRYFFKEVRNGNLDKAAEYLGMMMDSHLTRFPDSEEMLTMFVSSHLIFTLDLTGYLDIIEGVPLEPIIFQKIHQFFEEYHDEPDATHTLAANILHCVSMFSQSDPFQQNSPVSKAENSSDPHTGRMRIVRAYVDQHFSDPNLSVSTLADRFDLSVSYLSRLFHQVTGLRLGEYIQMRRFQEANQLLRLTDLPISEIAERCGFSSCTAFIRSYRAKEGVTPGARRKQAKVNSDPKSRS
jgi:AraC-like DNA-binding protein